MKTMKMSDYSLIISFIEAQSPNNLFETVVRDVKQKYESTLDADTLLSICLTYHQNQVKSTFSKKCSDEMIDKYYQLYIQQVEKETETGSATSEKSALIEISKLNEIPPALLARFILKKHLAMEKVDTEEFIFKEEVARYMKSPHLIQDKRLSYEVRQCVINDVGYGPITDSIRHLVGLEYEQELVENVKKLNVPFQDENDLRKLGYDKTPDIKLEIPFAVKGQVVCWIESKASFGSPEAHKNYLDNQYYSYLNRFGPGLVIYWFGFVEEFRVELQHKGIMLMDHFPEESTITRFDPSSARNAKPLA